MGNCADNGFQVLSTTAANCERTDSEDDDGGHGPDSIIAFNEDCNVVMLLRGYDFIHLDPFGSTVQHLDAAFRYVECVEAKTDFHAAPATYVSPFIL